MLRCDKELFFLLLLPSKTMLGILDFQSDNSNNGDIFIFLSLGRDGLLVCNEAHKANNA